MGIAFRQPAEMKRVAAVVFNHAVIAAIFAKADVVRQKRHDLNFKIVRLIRKKYFAPAAIEHKFNTAGLLLKLLIVLLQMVLPFFETPAKKV